MAIITLTTDFGTRDGYVGAVKGVISRVAPQATIVDIAHDIPRGDVAHAAWVVATSTLEFPHETIHVVVVDPGVGGERPAVVLRVPAAPPRGEQTYVGPDNGVFAYLPAGKAWALDPAAFPDASPTFHGRDVFAHVAAWLAIGRSFGNIDRPARLTGRLPWGPRTRHRGHVVHVDQYGNLITDLPADEAGQAVVFAGRRFSLVRTFVDVQPGEVLAYVGSAGTIEIAVRDGDAAHELGVDRGAEIVALQLEPAVGPKDPYR